MTAKTNRYGWTQITDPTIETMARSNRVTILHHCFGFMFFEHPTEGDESPILCRDKTGAVWNTHDFDLPEYL